MGRKANEEKISICKTQLKVMVRDRLLEKENIKVTSSLVSMIVDELFDTMTEELIKGTPIVVRGFGTFSQYTTRRFLARHPQDKTSFYYRPEQKSISFKLGKTLKRDLNDKNRN